MPAAPDTIVLIHGLYLDSRSWEGWAEEHATATVPVAQDAPEGTQAVPGPA